LIDAILKVFGLVVKFCYSIGQNYLVALLLFAVIVKIAMLPLSIKQQKNSIKQANLRPKEMAIRKKYAGRNDQATQKKVQEEIMDLYQRENFNPMGGCLPLLIQLPILLGLYQVVIRPLEFLCGVPKNIANELMQSAEVMSQIELVDILKNNFSTYADKISEYIKSAEELPNFNILGLELARIPSLDDLSASGLLLLLVPVFTFVFMFISMKINKKFTYNANEGVQQDQAAGCSTKLMDWMMPLMSVYISFIVPAVIGIYWIFNNIIGTVQQVILAKIFPLPKFTEEDYKNAEREMNGKNKKKHSANSGNSGNGEKKKVRSLHRIDEEDYIPAPAKKENTPEDKSKLASMIDKPVLKEEDKDNEK